MGFHSIPAVGVADVGEGHITILPYMYSVIGQGTWTYYLPYASQVMGIFYNSSGANGDNISYKVYLQAGTYTLQILVKKDTDQAILDVDIDDTEVATEDLYNSPAVFNYSMTQADIVIAASGLYTLKLRADGKNGSSSAYRFYVSVIALWRTA